MSNKIKLLLDLTVCLIVILVQGEALGAPDLRNPFAFPAGVRKGDAPGTKEGAAPGKEAQDSQPVFKVTTILVGISTRVAAINGVLVRKGEELQGYRIVEIEEKKVTLSRGKEKLMLRITPDERLFFKKADSNTRVMGFSK